MNDIGKKKFLSLKTFVALFLCVLTVFAAGCKKSDPAPTATAIPDIVIPDPAEPTATPVHRDTSEDTSFAETMVYANETANSVQGYYSDARRSQYVLENDNVIVSQNLTAIESFGTDITTKDGKAYITDSLDVFAVDKDGVMHNVASSYSEGRVNTTRLGYYYYDANIRDLYFGREVGVKYQDGEEVSLSADIWSVNEMSAPAADSDGNLIFTVSSAEDPYFYTQSASISHKTCNGIEVTMKVDGDCSSVDLYYHTVKFSGFNEQYMYSFEVVNDGQFHKYVIPVDDFNAVLQGIRLDVGSSVGDVITLQSIKGIYIEESTITAAAEKTFHTYSEKLHFEASLLSPDETTRVTNIAEFGYTVSFEKSTVSAMQISADGQIYNDASNGTFENTEYVAFDIKDAGVVGFIIPNDEETYSVKIDETDSAYVLYVSVSGSGKRISSTTPASMSSRIYTDTTHSFDDIAKTANIERNPLEGITVESSNNAKFIGYDYAEGVYLFTIDGTNFASAYRASGKNKYYSADISVTAADGRTVYISMKSRTGHLEAAVIADEEGTLLPIPLEVCKNFEGEKEEPVYDPADKPWGYTIFPLITSAEEDTSFTIYNLYQNWGNYPLKQISSVSFHVSYYHMSTGVTESNCIGPYFIFGKDGWVLPDFRAASSPIWRTQPQHNSTGRLYFTRYTDSNGNEILSEYTSSVLKATGTSYIDMDYSYVADDGSYEYTLRHVELPQTDENRTYYTLSLRFLKTTVLSDVKNQLELFTYDSRESGFVYKNASYRAEDNTTAVITNKNTGEYSDIYVLGKEAPYFSYYGYDKWEKEPTYGANFGLIVSDSYVTAGGVEWDGNFVFKNEYDGTVNSGSLSLNETEMVFYRNDVIELQLILLPYGEGEDTSSDNVDYVIEDSVTHKFKLTSDSCEIVDDYYVPSVKAVENEAVVTATGGRNNCVIKADGFTKLCVPKIYEQVDGEWVEYDYHARDNDGYSVEYEFGYYSYSFVCDMGDDPANASRTFKIVAE